MILGGLWVVADLGMVVDVVNENNQPVGIARRGDVLQRKLSFRTVHVFLFDQSEKLLLQKLPHNHLRSPGRLGSSVAGYLYSGETYQAAARRKMRQELSIDSAIRHVDTWPMIDAGSRKFVGLFSGAISQTPIFDPEEIAEIVYMDLEEVGGAIRRDQHRFTQTFVFAYERFREVDRAR